MGVVHQNLYHKIKRVWGNPIDGWSGLVHVNTSKEVADAGAVLSAYVITIPFNEKDSPYDKLYKELKKKLGIEENVTIKPRRTRKPAISSNKTSN